MQSPEWLSEQYRKELVLQGALMKEYNAVSVDWKHEVEVKQVSWNLNGFGNS